MIKRNERSAISILLADSNPAICTAFSLLLTHKLDAQVIGVAGDWDSLVSQCTDLRPGLLLLEWHLPGFQGKEALKRLYSNFPGLKVLVMGIQLEDRQSAMDAAADGFIHKADSPDRVIGSLLPYLDIREKMV